MFSRAPGDHVHAKLGDFGLSVVRHSLELNEPLESWQWYDAMAVRLELLRSLRFGFGFVRLVLTPRLAPEVIRGASYNESSDVYSLATLVYEVFSRTIPFSDVEQSVNV